MNLLYCLIIFIISCSLTGLLRRYALASNLVDIPNHRSSHDAPTPRGGGVAFVICFLLTAMTLHYFNLIASAVFQAIIGAGSFVALLGFLDDHGNVPAKWRLLGHFAGCAFALYCLNFPALTIIHWTIHPGVVVNIVIVFFLVWLLNLYNFMDGIDGIAAVEALTACAGGALLYYFTDQGNVIFLPLSLAFSVLGFLIWNFPPAKIFMGDAGSGFLGLTLGILSIQAGAINPNFFWAWLILLGVFIVDATITLIRRGLRGEILSEAHRSHAYQHASRYYGKHLPVTVGILIINVVWLMPIALAVGLGHLNSSIGLLISYTPLIVLAFAFHAGKQE